MFPVRLPIRAVLALIRRIQRSLAEPTTVISEYGDPVIRKPGMHVVVPSDMLSEAVHENE